jgi:hypothetical protein
MDTRDRDNTHPVLICRLFPVFCHIILPIPYCPMSASHAPYEAH